MDRRVKYIRKYLQRKRNAAQPPAPRASAPTSYVIIPRSEMEFISRCIQDYDGRETGGQMWGHRTEDGTPVIDFVSGPGPMARHNTTSFFQDEENFHKVDDVASGRYNLEHIGEWHSHHRMGLRHPSGGDVSTMCNALARTGKGHMLVCIGNLNDDGTTSVGAFLFSSRGYSGIPWDVRDYASPVGDAIRRELAGVMPMPETRKARCAFSPDDRRNGRAQYIRGYWLEQKENRAILQKIAECVGSVNGIMPEIIMDGDRLFHLRTRLPNGVEDIAFPAGFPHAPYILRINGNCRKVTWRYDGDIHDAFFKSYVLENGGSALY